MHGVGESRHESVPQLWSDSVYSVQSVVKNSEVINHRVHRMHGVGNARLHAVPQARSHSVCSVQSVVKNSDTSDFNHRVHRIHGVGKGLGKTDQLFGERMDLLIAELNKELTA